MPLNFEDIEVGEELGPVDKVVSSKDVEEFTRIQREDGSAPSFFTDDEAAHRAGLPGKIVPGPICMAFMAQLLVGWSDGGWVRKLDVVFRQTVPHNTPLRVVGVVTDKYQVDDKGHIECDIYVESEEGGQLVGGQAVVVLPIGPLVSRHRQSKNVIP